MRLSLLTCFILSSLVVFSQEIPADLLKKMEKTGQQKSLEDSLKQYTLTSKKGIITFANGGMASFKSIRLERDSVMYQRSDRNVHKIAISEVSLITEMHRHRGLNALVAGGFGLLSGLLVGVLAYPDENNLAKLFELIFSDDVNELPKISAKSIPLVIGTTAAGALLGAFVITFKDEKEVIYKKNNMTVSLVPEITATADVHAGYLLTARIRF
jgi:hypothetical protein